MEQHTDIDRTRLVKRKTGKPVYRFQTGNRFAKCITGYQIFVTDFFTVHYALITSHSALKSHLFYK